MIPPALRATSLFKGGLKTPPPCRAPPLGEEARGMVFAPTVSGELPVLFGAGRCGHRPLQSLRLLLTEQPPPFSREAWGDGVRPYTLRTGKQGFPGGGNRRFVCRDAALFSPLDWGVRLSGGSPSLGEFAVAISAGRRAEHAACHRFCKLSVKY